MRVILLTLALFISGCATKVALCVNERVIPVTILSCNEEDCDIQFKNGIVDKLSNHEECKY